MPAWWGLVSFAGILLIPAIGFDSTFTHLRASDEIHGTITQVGRSP